MFTTIIIHISLLNNINTYNNNSYSKCKHTCVDVVHDTNDYYLYTITRYADIFTGLTLQRIRNKTVKTHTVGIGKKLANHFR